MYRLICILLAFAIPVVGMAQTCIESEDEFVYDNLLISSLTTCQPSVLYTDLSICELAYISVDLSSAAVGNQTFDPDKLVIDIRQPGSNCFVRFASAGIPGGLVSLDLCTSYSIGGLSVQPCDPYAPISWQSSQQYLFNIDTSVFTSNLSGFWVISLSYLDADILINRITLDFVGSCCLDVSGCTYSNACNYDPNANIDDSSCEFTSCAGCIDATACNYDSTATINDGYCNYPDEFLDCNHVCLNDADFDGICDELEVFGCTEPGNPAYDSAATEDDGSCLIIVNGCTYTAACNYDPLATSDDGQCIFMDGVLTFQILTDNYPEETTWNVSNASGIVVANGGPYADPNTLYEDNICIDVGCYTLTINDSYGDGICCDYGLGSYSLIWNNDILVTGGQFGDDDTQTVCIGTQGCTYPNACNYDADANEDDGTCVYPSDIDACDCLGNQTDALGVCGGGCLNDLDGDGVCDDADECVGIVDQCGVCNGPGAIYDCGCDSLDEGICDCSGTPCSMTTQLLQIDNPFLELSYVQNATPFISLYDGWCDADFVTIGICRPNAILDPSEFLSGATSDFEISITFEDSWIGVLDFPIPATEQLNFEFTLELPAASNTPTTASQIVSVILKDDSGNTLDYLYQDEVPLPNVTLNGIYNAPGQHRIIRQPWVLQGNTEIIESEWLVCDENSSLSFYSSWNLESITQVPLDPISQECLNDLNGDGICDQLELPVFCQNVNATNYSPLQNTLICDEAEVLEYWISSFNIPEIAQQGGVLPPLTSEQQPVSTAMVSSDLCFSSAAQLAYCNVGQRAFVVDQYNQSIRIIDYGDLTDPAMIPDGLGGGGFLSISADNMSTELTDAGVSDYESLVPSDIDIFNVVGPDDTTYCCSTMVAVAWMDTLDLISSGWITLHDIDGVLLTTIDAVQEVGPTPRSLAFSQDGTWLVVACSGEGEHEPTDPMAEIVCIEVTGYTQGTADPVMAHVFTFETGPHIVGNALSITGSESRTSALAYDGNDDLSHMLEPSHVAITPDSERAFVNCQVNNTLVEVNLENVLSGGVNVITGAYGFGTRNMGTGSGFDGKDDGEANLQVPSETIFGWYQPGDIEIVDNGFKTILLTANEGMPSLNGLGEEDFTEYNTGDYSGLNLDSKYGYGADGSGVPYVFGSRSFALWDITTSGSLDNLYDSGSLIEETLAELMPEYANSVKSTYDSGDSASVSRGPEPSGIAFGTLKEQEILIVSLEGMGGSMIFDLIDWDTPSSVSASYQAYATNRDFQNPGMNQCLYNHLGAKDVLFLHSTVTDNTSVNEGYESILVSNDVTGSLSLFRLDSNLKIPGCTDSCACNYNDNATLNDGSCDFDSCVYLGCMYPDADNYDSAMTLDDGSCVFTNDCPADLDGDNVVGTGDLLSFLSQYGMPCP